MARDKGNKGSQTGDGDKRKGANRAARGTTRGGEEKPQRQGFRTVPHSGSPLSRIETQVKTGDPGESTAKEENPLPKGPKGGD